MGIISTLLGTGIQANRDPSDDFWYEPVSPQTAAGVRVSPASAVQVSAVYACIKTLAESIAMLPVKIYQRQDGGDKRLVRNHPIYTLLHDQPNDEQTAYQFKLQMMAAMVSRGNAYAHILPGQLGPVNQLIPLDPDQMRPERVANGNIRYNYSENGRTRTLSQDEVWHIPAGPWLAEDGISALSPLELERQAVGEALATRDYSARFFANDTQPPGWIEHPSGFKDVESRGNFRRAWQAAQGGTNRGKTAVLEHGMKYHPSQVTNEQAQFLETRKYQDVDIARIYRIPPHKIGILDRATFSNIEQQAIEFVTDTLLPWLVCWEQAIKKDLIIGEQFFAEFSVDALLRGDLLSRYQAYAIGRNWGWLSANDVLRRENENSIGPDGDTYLQPTNMMPADEPSGPQRQNNVRSIR